MRHRKFSVFLLPSFPTTMNLPILRAESLVVLGRYEDADMAFDAALSLNPDNPDIWFKKR